MQQVDVEKAKKRESYIASEFYRVAKGALKHSNFAETISSLEEILPEVPVGDKKADIVIVGKQYDRRAILLVVECKQRALTAFGRSYATAIQQAWKYAENLDSRFFAVYDGWLIFTLQRYSPYLIGAYNAELEKELTDSMASELFVGLMEYAYRSKSDKLSRLPRPRDPELVKRKILPSIARSIARHELQHVGVGEVDEKSVENKARQLIEQWVKNMSL